TLFGWYNRERTEFAPPWSMITSRRRQPNPWPPLLRISQDPNDRRDNTGACGSGSPYSIRWDRHVGPACRPLRSPLRRGFLRHRRANPRLLARVRAPVPPPSPWSTAPPAIRPCPFSP